MKRKIPYLILGAEAALCLLGQFFLASFPRIFVTALAFPFEQIGLGLRALSLSGATGNTLALILYGLLCLVPLALVPWLGRRRKLVVEDGLLVLLSAVLFAVMYLMINPGLLRNSAGNLTGPGLGKALMGAVLYSIIIGYLLLRVLRLSLRADAAKLQKYLAALLWLLTAVFVYAIFGACTSKLVESFQALCAGNTQRDAAFVVSCVFLILQYCLDALAYVLDILVAFAALDLLYKMRADRYSEAAVAASGKLSHRCAKALAFTATAHIVFNLLQLLFYSKLLVVNGTLSLPLSSIAFVLAALLLAQYIQENKRLKDDNDMFI